MPTDQHALDSPPPDLLQAVANCGGHVAIVVGAGCSLEAPTGLKLAEVYSREIERQMVANKILAEGECADPDDLSALSSLVFSKQGEQGAVVRALPRTEFRDARANDGYLLAAALMREGAISCLLSLNYDLGMSNALTQLGSDKIATIQNPNDLADFGSQAVVYLHRNVNESDLEKWILRAEALEDEWRDDWEQVVAQRVTSAPVTVFAGLGSPAAVLTETIQKIRGSLSEDTLRAFVVDPGAESAFKDALRLPANTHIQMRWGDFMAALAKRVLADHTHVLDTNCANKCAANGWDDDLGRAKQVVSRTAAKGLIHFGKARSSFLLDDRPYAPDDERRELLPDLVLAISLIEAKLDAEAEVCMDGVVNFRKDGGIVASTLVASGRGHMRWAEIEPRVRERIQNSDQAVAPAIAVLGGVMGTRPESITPPLNLIDGDPVDDILADTDSMFMLSVDDVRSDPARASELAS